MTPPLESDLSHVLLTEECIRRRVDALAREISEVYRDEDEIIVISIINGAIPFTADLIRRIDLPIRLDCLRVSTYRDDTRPHRNPELIDTLRLPIKGHHVLLVDDILDTGRTFARVVNLLKKMGPASLRVCVLLDKIGRREIPFHADFVGFKIPDEFVVGYGLDFAERYRNLRCIGVLRPELQNPPEWQ